MQIKAPRNCPYVMFPIAARRVDNTYLRWVKIDREDAPVVALYNWHLSFDPTSGKPYPQTRLPKKQGGDISMGRLLLGESDLGNFARVDHINGNPTDHRRANLRWATQEQVLAKRRPPANGHSRFKGVTWDAQQRKWLVAFKGRKVGRFHDERDAARAFDEAALEYWEPRGVEPYLNFPRTMRGVMMDGPRARRLTTAIDQCLGTDDLDYDTRVLLTKAQRAVEHWAAQPPLWIQPRDAAVNQ